MLHHFNVVSVTPEGSALRWAFLLLFRSSRSRTRSSSRLFVSFIPLRDKRLVRSRVIQITNAPAGRVIRLRGVAELVAQRNLISGSRPAFGAGAGALLKLSHLFRHDMGRSFFPGAFLLYCLAFLTRRSVTHDSRNGANSLRSVGSPSGRNHHPAAKEQEEAAGR